MIVPPPHPWPVEWKTRGTIPRQRRRVRRVRWTSPPCTPPSNEVGRGPPGRAVGRHGSTSPANPKSTRPLPPRLRHLEVLRPAATSPAEAAFVVEPGRRPLAVPIPPLPTFAARKPWRRLASSGIHGGGRLRCHPRRRLPATSRMLRHSRRSALAAGRRRNRTDQLNPVPTWASDDETLPCSRCLDR